MERVLGHNNHGTLTIRKNIADYTGNTGDVREALRLFRALLPEVERVLDADDSDSLSIRGFIARYTEDTGEALRLYRALLADEERVMGPDHPGALFTRKEYRLLDRGNR